MINGFTTYRLVRDGSASPVLVKQVKTTFHDLSSNSTAEVSGVLLQSGFSGLHQDSHVFLSPALQLNGDLAGLEEKELRLFAEAERIRKNLTSFGSYTIEPDNRVCVVSDNVVSLSRFLNTYGGILDIVPLLIKGSHPGFSEVTELDASYNRNRYRIEYSARSPVDQKKCTYCGLCARSCPKTCISEKLFFDFEACNFCRECEKICPTEALDIYAVDQTVLEIPAILALGDTKVEMPEGAQRFYRETDLEKYLSTLFPLQVDEVITCNHNICQYSSRTEAGCNECIQACSFGAITGEDNIVINPLKCLECGRCAGACPTGAIEYHRLEDSMFSNFFRTFQIKEETIVVFGSEEELHRFWWLHRGSHFDNHLFFESSRSEALSAFHLLFMLAHGASHVIIINAEQDNHFIQRTIDSVNNLVKDVFGKPVRVHLSTPEEYPFLMTELEETSVLLENFNELKYSNRRQKISSIFQHAFAHINETITLENDSNALFHSIVCEEDKCTQCLACLNECRIQALSSDPTSLTLCWTGSLCTGCCACVDVCPENALSTGNEVILTPSYFLPAVIAQAEPIHCKECGKIFGTRKSYDRVMEILAKQKMDLDGHLEYCEDCRVIKLSESG